jgi:hypothetical protein
MQGAEIRTICGSFWVWEGFMWKVVRPKIGSELGMFYESLVKRRSKSGRR